MILTKINVLHSVSLNSYSDCQHGQKADYFSNLCNTSSVQMCVSNRTRLPKCLWISRNKLENGSTGINVSTLFLDLVSALQNFKGGCEEMRRRSRMFWIYLSRLSHSKCGVRNIFLSSHYGPQGRFCPPGLDNILCIKGWYIMGFDCKHKAQTLWKKD